jgi:hypothetical protein
MLVWTKWDITVVYVRAEHTINMMSVQFYPSLYVCVRNE